MTNTPKLLEAWNSLKQTILKKRIKAQEEIKFILHELVLTLSSEMSSHSPNYESAFQKYQKEPPQEIQKVFELANTRNPEIGNTRLLPHFFRNWYYQPLIDWIKDKAKELKVSWE